jgi:hypothetical protein
VSLGAANNSAFFEIHRGSTEPGVEKRTIFSKLTSSSPSFLPILTLLHVVTGASPTEHSKLAKVPLVFFAGRSIRSSPGQPFSGSRSHCSSRIVCPSTNSDRINVDIFSIFNYNYCFTDIIIMFSGVVSPGSGTRGLGDNRREDRREDSPSSLHSFCSVVQCSLASLHDIGVVDSSSRSVNSHCHRHLG